jgi:galactose mutarotase-like enzyme
MTARYLPAVAPVLPTAGPVGDRTWDDAFDEVAPGSRFELSGGGRTIEVRYSDGFPFAQIFAPPGQEYLCVEPMTAPANALRGPDSKLEWVPARGRRSASFRIACQIGSSSSRS